MGRAVVVILSGWMLGLAVGAAPAAAGGDAWDDGHMRSRYRSLLASPLQAPEVHGADRYGALAEVPTQAPRDVPETLQGTTQRSWKSGPSVKTTRRANPFTGSLIRGGSRSERAPGSSLGSRSRSGVQRRSGR